MAQPPNTPNPVLRIAILIVLVMASVGIIWAVGKNSSRQQPPASAPGPSAAPAGSPAGGAPAGTAGAGSPQPGASGAVEKPAPGAGQTATPPATTGPAPAAAPAATPPPAPGGYKAVVFSGDPLAGTFGVLGSLDPAMAPGELTFSGVGAGIRDFRLSEHFDTWKKNTHHTLQAERTVPQARQPDGSVAPGTLTPMAALAIKVNGVVVVLATNPAGPVWRQVAADKPGVFEAFVEDAAGHRVLRIERAYSLKAPSHEVRIDQKISNLTDAPVQFEWYQFGPVDLSQDADGYGGDRRRMPFGYLQPPAIDPKRQVVSATDYVAYTRLAALGAKDAIGNFAVEAPVWPNGNSTQKQLELSWAGFANRYFGVAAHPWTDPGAAGQAKAFAWVAGVDRVLLNAIHPDGTPDDPVVALRLRSGALTVGPGGTQDVSMGLWMGPLSHDVIHDDPVASTLGLDGMIVGNMGGPCMYCTFDIITIILRSVLHFLHDQVFHDWALAIIFLVVFVRTCLHPLTRWSQIRMQRFGKQMALMQPKQKKIQERYKDDPKKMQAEMAALWREEGISPFGMLGCLPMLLVTPVWLSLYAVLFYTVEMRNEPAFYGIVQKLTGNAWGFLADLSHPDSFFSLGTTYKVPVLSAMMGPISSVNVLPLLLGLVFYFHQKYLTPPSTTPLTPEQETQQKMVKVMSVLMFPLFMYNSPAGLALYFTTNSTLAIVENAWIRKHINKHGLLEEHNLRRKPRDPNAKGFMQRLMEAAETKRKLAEAQARKDQLDRGRGRK